MTQTSSLSRPILWAVPQSQLTPEQIEAKAQVLYERLRAIASTHADVRFATSLAAEDMVVTLVS